MSNTPAIQNNTTTKVHWGFWLGLIFFALVVVTMLVSAWFLSIRMMSAESAPVTVLVIDGETPYTRREDIVAALAPINLGNFFKLDVNQVQSTLVALPWVYSVSVRKQWPNQLKVYVVDQQPVAIWNVDFLINQHGNAFQADQQRIDKALPAFFGPEGTEQIALENFENLSSLLTFRQLQIDELMLSERHSWQLTLGDGVTLNLGRENTVERIQRFMDVYQQIKRNSKENQQVDYVDLRYDTGLAVGWKTVQEQRA